MWDGIVVAETPRLLLRTFRVEDLPAYAALHADPEVMATLGGVLLDREESDGLAVWHQGRYEANGYGLLAVERRADGAFLGMSGLHHQRSFPDEVELAYRFAREHWGQGYATEAGAAWLDVAFERVGRERVIGIGEESNPRTLAVMRRLGMTPWWAGTVHEGDEEFEAIVHAVSADTWRVTAGRRDGARGRPTGR